MPISVCFVCLGNICRSPTAEAVFASLVAQSGLGDAFEIDSAGTAAYHSGEAADRRSREEALRHGVEITSVARQFRPTDFARFDYILAMDTANLRALRQLPGAREHDGHLGLFRAFDETAPTDASVPDPYYGGAGGFTEVFRQCERAASGLLSSIRGKHQL